MLEKFKFSREAAKITMGNVSSWEELNAFTLEEADKKFNQKTKETWKEFAVHGLFLYDKKEGKQVLKPFTDLDGKCSLGILKLAGIDTKNLTYVKPGDSLEGAINLDTGNIFGVAHEESTNTAHFDHHTSKAKEISSATEIIYRTMTDLGMIKKSEALDRLVDFVTKIDNRKFPPEEFLKSSKTILGLQRDLDFEKLLLYFQEKENPTTELNPEELKKYGLGETSQKQQEMIDEAMKTMEQMEKEGLVLNTKYGKMLLNFSNRLKVGSSAAYVKYDGIVNFTPGESFAISLKEGSLQGLDLAQGKLIRDQVWIYNENKPLEVTMADIVRGLGASLEKKEGEQIVIRSYCLQDLKPLYRLFRPRETNYYFHVDYQDPAIVELKDETSIQKVLSSGKRIVEASLYEADDFIRNGSLDALRDYFDSWKEIKSPSDTTFHEIRHSSVPASDGWGYEEKVHVFPDFYEYLVFLDNRNIEEIKKELEEKTLKKWLKDEESGFKHARKKYPHFSWIGDLRIDGANQHLWIASKRIRNEKGQVDHYDQGLKEQISFSDFEMLCREFLGI